MNRLLGATLKLFLRPKPLFYVSAQRDYGLRGLGRRRALDWCQSPQVESLTTEAAIRKALGRNLVWRIKRLWHKQSANAQHVRMRYLQLIERNGEWQARGDSNPRLPPCQFEVTRLNPFACFAFPFLTISKRLKSTVVLVTNW